MATACPDCGTLLSIPPLPRRSTAICLRCRTPIESTTGRSINVALACAVATLLLLPSVDTLPLLKAELLGQSSERSLAAGVAQLWHHDWVALTCLSVVFVILLPAVRMTLLALVLGALRLGLRPPWLGRAFRWAVWLDPWAMLDVFLLAVGVGYYYLTRIERLNVTIETGGFLLLAAGLLSMLSRAALDERTVWRAIGAEAGPEPDDRAIGCKTCGLIQPESREGARCLRCGARNRARRPNAATSAAALVAASFILLFPANIYPMNTSDLLGIRMDFTNFGYVRQLWQLGLWPLSMLTFWTSILTPALMIGAVGWCVLSVERHSIRRLVLKTQLLRLVAETGRWSETGPLSIVFFVPLIDFGHLGAETAGWGATAFIMMTLLMIAASVTFDSRLMWDASA
ncbi:MAG TPA: paraquat-inducible protein A [Steroidobacteraceae bacterium]|nr:paraquat-inducible protein A [Steroidobacteraceae bacterium]